MKKLSLGFLIISVLLLGCGGGSSATQGVSVSFQPEDAAADVALSISTTVTATFSGPITEPAATDWPSKFTLIASGASATSCTAVAYDSSSRVTTCTHGLLTGNTNYTLTVSGLIDSEGTAISTLSATFTTAAPSEWTIEDGTRLTGRTSSSTIMMPDGTFRMFLAGVMVTTSTDGLTWETPSFVTGAQDMSANVAILAYSDGTYILISEVAGDERRFYRYISTDGITFTQTPGSDENGSVLSPSESDGGFISVPDMVELDDGSIRLYFVATGDHSEAALSTDKGLTWTREGSVTVSDIADGVWVVDPDIIKLDDGRWWLFFATSPDGTPGAGNRNIQSGTSTDGLTFTLEDGVRVDNEDSAPLRLDPDLVKLSDGSYRMYFGEQGVEEGFNIRSATSPE